MNAEAAPAFVDTNILVYCFQRRVSDKQAMARRVVEHLMGTGHFRASTQVMQELFVTLTRKVEQPCSMEEALGYLESVSEWPIFVVDYPAIREAGRLAGDAQISFWDALIVVAAARSGAERLYTEDLNHGQRILGVEIVNPFRPEAA